jgi:16S rRNA (guanine1207-N2)-methyltransferase
MDRSFDVEIAGVQMVLATAPRLFSPRGLDSGTRFLIESLTLGDDERICDLGCGYGSLGIWAAKRLGEDRVVMIDIDREAVDLAIANAERNGVGKVTIVEADGFDAVDEAGFTWICCNPPYHVDWDVPKKLIRKSFNRLRIGGRLALVVKRRDWYENQVRKIFGGCAVTERDGYHVIIAERRQATRNR